jgi:hypothetical protein
MAENVETLVDTKTPVDNSKLLSALNVDMSGPLTYQNLAKKQSALQKEIVGLELSTADLTAKRDLNAAKERKKSMDAAITKYDEQSKTEQDKLDSFGDIKFQPTQDNLKDIAGLFSAVGIIGAIMGGGGRNSSMNALSSMTGMLDGWKQGRADLFKKEKIAFDEHLNSIKSQKDTILQKMNMIEKEYSRNKEKAEQDFQVFLAEQNSPILKNIALTKGVTGVAAILNNTLGPAVQNAVKLQNDMTMESVRQANRIAIKNMELANQKSKDALKAGDLPTFIREQTGANLNPKDSNEVGQAALSVGHAYALMGKVQEHPEWVGRSGQIKQFFNRYVDSLNNNKPLPPDDPKLLADKSGQEALVFAKDYAAYLVNYERALAGGARGFTVSFQNRFNKLLDQNQFNPTGFQNLMIQQIDEISNNASVKSPGKINKENISNMGMIIYEKDPDAIRGYQSMRKPTSPKSSQIPTVKSKEEFNALPKGSEYYEEDGRGGVEKYRKP